MQDSNLQAQPAEFKAQIARLKDRLSTGVPTVHKDLLLISLVSRWSGADSAMPLERFLENIETAAK